MTLTEMVKAVTDSDELSGDAIERFAALVRAQVLEEAAQKCSVLAQERETDYVTNYDCADALRGMKSDSGHPATADAGASTVPLPEGAA